MRDVYQTITKGRATGNNVYHLTEEELNRVVRHAITRTLTISLRRHPNVREFWETELYKDSQNIIDECFEDERVDEILRAIKEKKRIEQNEEN